MFVLFLVLAAIFILIAVVVHVMKRKVEKTTYKVVWMKQQDKIIEIIKRCFRKNEIRFV